MPQAHSKNTAADASTFDAQGTRTEALSHELRRCLDRVRDDLRALEALPNIPKEVDLATIADTVAKILRQVHSLQNESAIAGRLPNEILSAIFAIVQADLLKSMTGLVLEDSRAYIKWTRVMRVCQHWRYVAFATAFLWRTVFVPPRDLWPSSIAKGYFRRSANCLLRVYVASNAHPDSLMKVYTQLHRIQELRFEIHSKVLTLPMRWCVPGPTLETLALTSGLNTHFSPLPPIFLGNFRFLKSLSLRKCSSYAPLVCPNVTHLHIDGCWLMELQDLKSLFNILRGTPALEDLKFTDLYVGSFEGELRESSYPHVELPVLRRLAFVRDGTNIATVLSCLRLPAGVSLTFPWDRPFEHNEEIVIFPEDCEDLKNLQDLHDFELWFTADDFVTIRAVGHSSAVFSRWCMGTPADPVEFADDLPSILFQPRRLWIHMHGLENVAQRKICRQLIREILDSARYLRALFLDGDRESMVDDFVEILKHWGTEEDAPDPCFFLCTNLEEVHFRVDGNEKYVECQDILRVRKNIVGRLPTLYLHGQHLSVKNHSSIVRLCDSGVDAQTSEVAVPRMEWVPICTSQSSGPWDFPLWTQDGGCE